jgi:hypothetical protein
MEHSQLSQGATKSVAKFRCGGVAEFKLTHYPSQLQVDNVRDVLDTMDDGARPQG